MNLNEKEVLEALQGGNYTEPTIDQSEIMNESDQDDNSSETEQTTSTESTSSEDELRQMVEDDPSILNEITGETQTETTSAEFDINKFITDKTEGKYASWEDVVKKLSEEKVTDETNTDSIFANERIKRLNDLAKNGANIETVLFFEGLKLDQIDTTDSKQAMEVVKLNMKLSNPDMTDEEIEFELEDNYIFDEDLDDEKSIKRKKLKLDRDSRKAKQDLLAKQKELELPSTYSESKKVEEQSKKQTELYNQWVGVVDNSFKEYSKQTFKIGESEEFVFGVDDNKKNSLKSTVTNINQFWNRYVNKDGSTDMEKLKRDILVIENLETVLKSVADQYTAIGEKRLVERFKKPKVRSTASTPPNSDVVSIEQQIANQMNR